MNRVVLVAFAGLLLAACVQAEGPLLPELEGRWVPDEGTRVAMATTGSGAAIAPASRAERCERGYITFDRLPMDLEFAGSVTLHRQRGSEPIFMVGSASREGDRLTLTGRPPHTPPSRRMQVELVLRDGKVVFDDVLDRLGRSVSNDLFVGDESRPAERISFSTIGDHLRATLDLTSCRSKP